MLELNGIEFKEEIAMPAYPFPPYQQGFAARIKSASGQTLDMDHWVASHIQNVRDYVARRGAVVLTNVRFDERGWNAVYPEKLAHTVPWHREATEQTLFMLAQNPGESRGAPTLMAHDVTVGREIKRQAKIFSGKENSPYLQGVFRQMTQAVDEQAHHVLYRALMVTVPDDETRKILEDFLHDVNAGIKDYSLTHYWQGIEGSAVLIHNSSRRTKSVLHCRIASACEEKGKGKVWRKEI